MSNFELIIGNKNLSSWSLRPWLVMKHFDIPFTETMIWLDVPETRKTIKDRSASGLVPCLYDDDMAVWDSLAICEYLAESFPEKNLWPTNKAARARARSIAAEMHSGFSALRGTWPMEICKVGLNVNQGPGVKQDVAKVIALWEAARRDFGQDAGGPFLFGDFSIADAMFAPVVSRFETYGPVDMPDNVQTFYDAILALPAMQDWTAGAKAEIA